MPSPASTQKPAEITPEEINRVAEYGPPPDSILGAPGYFFSVSKRQKELKEKITEINERLEKTERERDGALATLGQSALDYGLLPEMAAELKAKVAEAEKSISAAKGRTSKETEQYEAELARLDGELKTVRGMIEPLLGREKSIDDDVASADTHHRRAAAMVQRIQIEMRNIEQGKVQNDQTELQARMNQLRTELPPLQAKANEAQTKLMHLKKEQATLKAQINPLRKKESSLEDERQAAVDEYEEKMGLRSEEAKRASAWRRSRLAVAGRKVYDQHQRPKLMDGERLFARIDQSEKKVTGVQRELELYLQALDSYDSEVMDKAKYIFMGAGGALAVLLLIILLYV